MREDHGLAYSIYSSLSYFDDTGTLTISAGLDIDNLNKTLKLILQELAASPGTIPSPPNFAAPAIMSSARLISAWKAPKAK